ncbi:DUF3422 family protein [Motiliproteus sp. SC1-56]|uniref:DUF3422 family protein n=1 Tax=Motiliproteus sp. SC1-56 TaxID=2799565 RepID=UPI001F5D8849|nr:DUF3422 domain-containing protein [Motiliproteus sp. SC1-56]
MAMSQQPSAAPYGASVPAASLNGRLPDLRVHPLREELYNELHSRPYQVLQSPSQLTHFAILHGGKLKVEEHQLLTALCDRFQMTAPTPNMPCFHQDFGLFELRWERHMEFSSYTFISKGPRQGAPFAQNALDRVPAEWLNQLPGQVVGAFHLLIEEAEQGGEPPVEQVADYFEKLRLVGSQPANGRAMVWTTFRLHSDGFGRFMIFNRGLTETQLGRLVQRFVELETYRLLTALGLPLAREIAPQLNTLELQLKQVTAGIAQLESAADERGLLVMLSEMAAQVEAFRARSNYRFSATRAYHGMVEQRLEVLREREREVAGHLTLNEFLERRLTPAVRTCEAIGNRLENLSTRIDRASELLRTRVQLGIEEQNQSLLGALNRRSRIQLRMQQTVEGLSVAAISYYLVSLLKLGYEALYAQGVPIDKSLATGLSIPVVMAVVWWGTRRIHHHFSRQEPDPQ